MTSEEKIPVPLSDLPEVPASDDMFVFASKTNPDGTFESGKLSVQKIKEESQKKRGYFNTYESLVAKYPNPSEGETATAGTPFPGTAYDVVDGAWHNTGVVPPADSIPINDYMLNGGSSKTGARLESDIFQSGVKYQYGDNLLNPNYSEGFNKGLNNLGGIVNNTGWYTTPPIRWNGETSLLCQRYRLSCQYDESGKFVPGSYHSTSSGNTELNIPVNKVSGAIYMRMMLPMTNRNISMIVKGENMPTSYIPFLQIVNSSLDGGSTVFASDISIEEKMQQWILAGSFKLTSVPTYTDGLLNSTIDVMYPDNGTGTINFTRNADGLITTLGANHNEQKKRMTIILTRNTEGNILTQSITFSNLA